MEMHEQAFPQPGEGKREVEQQYTSTHQICMEKDFTRGNTRMRIQALPQPQSWNNQTRGGGILIGESGTAEGEREVEQHAIMGLTQQTEKQFKHLTPPYKNTNTHMPQKYRDRIRSAAKSKSTTKPGQPNTTHLGPHENQSQNTKTNWKYFGGGSQRRGILLVKEISVRKFIKRLGI